MSTARRDALVAIEQEKQAYWAAEKLHEFDAPAPGEARPAKYLTTFPFPYMNGKLHLGHGFSLTKAEFASRFQRMMGRRSLWPFGFHVTGTPIAACAQKIAKEMQQYGNPPQFPAELLEDKPKAMVVKEPTEALGQHKSKRGKSGPAKPQWLIMQSMGIPDSEIAKFADPQYWLDYFPPIAMEDLKSFGCHIDWRRSFMTTERSPYFDRFVRWQFNILRRENLLNYGKRYCVYSPRDGQPCADHDRASGEGVLPQEYALVKLIVQNPLAQPCFAEHKDIIGDRNVVLPGATLRPETVIGQTNCWVSNKLNYKGYYVRNAKGEDEVYIMTARAARNIAYQNFYVNGQVGTDPEPLFEVEGASMVGIPLSAPLAPYTTIYTLPMATITEAKGTGVVMSVPSDSPDDYINFTQLLNKPEYRVKLGIKDEWVVPFAMIPIIDIPELGTEGAKFMCEKLKINGPNATELLEEAKKVCYQQGFYHGTMISGPYAGVKVSEAKVKTHRDMEAADQCIRYYEPVRQVISRSGDECVVALCDQWYLEYGKDDWKKLVQDHIKKMDMFFPGVRNGFEETLNWLADWPCSRTFGLGTYLPCDASHTMIIDSLSDSTIYMAYYTIDRFFNVGADGSTDLCGKADNPYGLAPEMFTDEVFEYIYHGVGDAATVAGAVRMPVESLKLMRNEFEYWYPVDLRCSGKDLIQNHLTMFLYNHAAIWPTDESKWPRAIFCNGHIQVDNEKMAKSRGNFISLREAMDMYGADATRLTCADAGDSMDDANFVRETAAGFVLKMTTLLEQAKETVERTDLRSGGYNEFDKIFNNTMNTIITRTEGFYHRMQFRMVLNTAFHELSNEYSQYKMYCDDLNVHAQLGRRYYEVVALMMMPLAPHTMEHLWQNILQHEGSVVTQPFPKPTAKLDYSLIVASRVMTIALKEIRSQVIKNAKKRGPVEEVIVYTRREYTDWQRQALEILHELYEANGNTFPEDMAKQVVARDTKIMSKALMAFMSFVKGNVEKYGEQAMSTQPVIDDAVMLSNVTHNLSRLAGVSVVRILSAEDETYKEHDAARRKCLPGEPSVALPPVVKRE
ncbi:leucyl-tRNA synthetase / LeuRS [Leishmania donovani]|uniref:leucine--tRNA ligase n=3 Tax=Leishmania donovani species complex TaxID=38574 RepID=A0A6L0WNN4_LEIIN|nr:putative leucyl-tRNA synthetase [Leishmania infantum JPCM5]CAC9466244.1 leucyl-tRNA_synthetase_-_putative [Leishmania infantum]CAJ1987201.1 leucyl-tRNA synthetase / LeuRS [Leishmania donovani]CAM66505.1 putative leucyl-tRNA synthetase [Leishmania infantum JPCM5]SUZ40160.1 leucyl-tRNA_synthetase_-_putative [Leishmania infantum]VDZ43090.1 leucyl-tRNA_synthetase_putative/GeneDB:LmjF.13.1100 [Leishmania donovani]|eukprot:XP_001464129.1 putative leucyl-tRNA synthetase [Leishmania infantum JPCM5]